MATTLFSDFLSGILVDVPGCPDIAVEREIRNAAIQLCRRSLCWRQQLDPVAVFANIGAYTLDSPQFEARVIKIYDVVLTTPSVDPLFAPDLRQLHPKTVQWLDAQNPSWRYPQANLTANYQYMQPQYYTQDDASQILLAGVPIMAGSLTILASLVPLMTATGMDSWVAEQHYEAIVHGAKARLMAIPQKPWTDFNAATWHITEFDKAISGASVEAAQGFQSDAPIRTTGYSK
jgi:hypothetical protein